MPTEVKTKKTKVVEKTEVKDAKAQSAKQNAAQQKAENVKALQEQEKKRKAESERKPSGVVTTNGNVIRHARVQFASKVGVAIIVGAMYGKLIEGKKGKEAEANLHKLPNRAMSKADYLEYQRQAAKDPTEAIKTAVAKVYPMHVDDKAYDNGVGQVSGRDVNYVTVNRITKEDVENGFAFENQVGRVKLMAGVKGEKEGRLIAILTPQEEAMNRHRAQVTVDEKGKVVSVGEPITKIELANIVAARQQAQKESRSALLDEAKGIDWGKAVVPVGAKLSKVYANESNQPDRVWINGTVNGVPAKGVLLTPVETLALREGLATKEQVFMHNAGTRSQAYDINKANYLDLKANSEAYSVKAIVDRASDPAAKSFTREQVEVINLHLSKDGDRQASMDSLVEKAEVEVKKAGVDESWLDAVKEELKDVVAGQWKEKSESVSVGR